MRDVVYREDILKALKLGMTVTQLEREIMVIPAVAVVDITEVLDLQKQIYVLRDKLDRAESTMVYLHVKNEELKNELDNRKNA